LSHLCQWPPTGSGTCRSFQNVVIDNESTVNSAAFLHHQFFNYLSAMATGATLLTDHPFRRPHLSTLLRSSNIPSFHPLRISIRINRLRPNFRCSIAEGSTALSPSKGSAPSSIVDCVVIGGGISGLCIAQALATKHSDVAPNILVTEARGRVGGNITTVERDGYLWEEGPNSFQPSDPILTMVVGIILVICFPSSPFWVVC